MSLSEIAFHLDSNKTTVKRWIDSGINEIKKAKINNRRLEQSYVNNDDVVEYIRKKENFDKSYYVIEFPNNYNWINTSFISYLYF